MTTQTSSTYWVCVDCYMAHAGISEEERGEAYPAAVLSLIDDNDEVTAGLISEEHDTPCGSFAVPDGEFLGGECSCEEQSFSGSRCDGCGTHLAGSRHALTVWTR